VLTKAFGWLLRVLGDKVFCVVNMHSRWLLDFR